MNIIRKVWPFFPIAFALCLITVTESHASTCLSAREGEFRQAKAIFIGKALSVGPTQIGPNGRELTPIRLSVVKSWKGSVGKETTVWTNNRMGLCDVFLFEAGETYLVYAQKDMFASSDCNSSKIASTEVAIEQIKQLNNWWFRFKPRLHL